MKSREKYHKLLKAEIINDPTKQGYNAIFKKRYKKQRDKYTKIAERINANRASTLGFPIVRTNVVELVMRDE